MKKLIYILLVLAVAGAVAFTLINNKKEMAEKVAIGEKTSDAIPVVMTTAQYNKVNRSFSAHGTYDPVQDLSLMSETQGQVTHIYTHKGDEVKKGQLLATVEDDILRADFMKAQASYEKTKKDLGRYENLSGGDAITKRQLEDARLNFKNAEAQLITAKKNLSNTRFIAPISGSINEDYIEVGSYVKVGDKLYDIVNVHKLKLTVNVSESEVPLLRRGMKVKTGVDVFPEKTFEGNVTAVAMKADNFLNYEVEVEVANSGENPLRAGMYGTAYFDINGQKDALLIKREAIAGSLQEPQVYVVKDQKAMLKNIVIGKMFDDKVEVLKGLENGEQLVLSGQINLKDGIKVSVLKAN